MLERNTHPALSGFIRYLVLLLLCGTTALLSAQQLTDDLDRLLSNRELAARGNATVNNPGLDTLITMLAYYAKAPDTVAAARIASGPAVLNEYSTNGPILDFLSADGVADMLWEYSAQSPTGFGWLMNEARVNYLRKPVATELFSRNGLVDVAKIEAAYSAPIPPTPIALTRAAAKAKGGDLAAPTASYLSTALTGLSDWISRRAQEELTYTFLTRLRDQLQEQELDHLFPSTVAYLPTLNLINYKSILPSIRLAFAKDLNQISFSLGEYLHARNADEYHNPGVYNLFLLYRILDLGLRDVPFSDILAFTYGQLSDSRLNTRRAIDIRLAEQARQTPEFSTVFTAYGRLVQELEQLERAFQIARNELIDIEEDLTIQFSENAVRPLRPNIDSLLQFNFSNLLFSREKAAEVVEAWLMGKENNDYYLANPNLSQYDELFGPGRDSITEDHLRAAGITGVRELLGRRNRPRELYGEFIGVRNSIDSLSEILNVPAAPDNAAALKEVLRRRLNAERIFFISSGVTDRDSLQLAYLDRLLQEVLVPTGNPEAAIPRLEALSNRLDTFVTKRGASDSPNYLRLFPPARETELYPDILARVEAVEGEFVQLSTALEAYSWNTASDLIRAHRNAANFETVFGLGKELFFLLYDKKSPPPTLLSSGGLATSLVPPPLAKGDEESFATPGQLTSVFLDQKAGELLRGLAMERLANVPNLGGLQPAGVGQLVMDFSDGLRTLKAPVTGSPEEQRNERRIRAVNFITTTVSNIVEAPILSNPLQPAQPQRLADRIPGFASIPEINNNLNELFRLSQTGEFRYAITNLLNLIDLFGIVPTGNKKQKRLQQQKDNLTQQLADVQSNKIGDPYASLAFGNNPSLASLDTAYLSNQLRDVDRRLRKLDTARVNKQRQRLFLYGTFMADVAAANTPEAFAAALDNVALPPGSSQLKRNKPFSLELNAYFGFNFAREVLDLPEEREPGAVYPEAEGNSVALYVPVGLSISWKNRYTQKSSYSLFFPFIDLGAVSAYRLDNGSGNNLFERLPRFTFQNVFAPGAHFKYNIAKTPFTMGIGAQYGPNTRRIFPDGSSSVDVSAIRYMVTFSVDVPIFSFTNRP